jgi:hypothetical protein
MRNLFVVAIAFVSVVSLSGQDKESRKTLEQDLRSAFKLTKTSKLEKNNVTEPGAVFVVQQEGMAADLAHDAVVFTSRVVDGTVSQRGGTAGFFSKGSTKHLNLGDRVYLTDIDVKDDRIRVGMLTAETFQVIERGKTQQARYKGYVDFEFDKAAIVSMDSQTATKAIEAVLLREDKVAGSKTKTIELGQTLEQVEATFGKPISIAKLGAKTIYTYKDMKVVFTDGKVSDVQ